MQKETVKKVQRLLFLLGNSPGEIDGLWGNNSEAALDATLAEYDATDNNVGSNEDDWWDKYEYFTRKEFACPCGRCGGFPVEPVEKLVMVENRIRKHFGRPAHNSSGVRCYQHNAEVGGVSTSRHMKGWAVDFCIEGVPSSQLNAVVGAQSEVAYHYQIDGSYVHMDVIL